MSRRHREAPGAARAGPPRSLRRRVRATPRSLPPTSPSASPSTTCLRRWPRPRRGRTASPMRRPRPAASSVTSTTVPVTGMTCRTCEVRIQKTVGRLPSVQHVTASAVHGRVEIQSSAPVDAAAVEKAIRAAGYEVGRTPWLASDPGRLADGRRRRGPRGRGRGARPA